MSTIRSVVPLSFISVSDWKDVESVPVSDRVRRPHECEHCGRYMEWDDQQCACTSRSNRVGWVR